MSEFFRQLVNRLRRGLGSGAAARRPRPSRLASLSLEALGDRIVPTLVPVFNAGTGALTITGDNTSETATIAADPSGNITLNGVGTGATLSSITSLTVSSNGGDDVLNLSALPNLGVPVTIDGGAGNDVLTGSAGADVMRGGSGNDTLNGGNGNDDLDGGLNTDVLNGQQGNDVLRDSGGSDTFDGGGGTNTLVAMDSQANTFRVTATYQGDLNGETFTGIQVLQGGALQDTFVVNTGGQIDDLQGQGGNDTFKLTGGVVNDNVDGGGGVDQLSYANVAFQVSVNLTTGGATNVGGLVSQVENVTGGLNNDLLVGDGGNNRLDGGDGNDAVLGMGGDDTLIESAGSLDSYNGGTGNDTLVAMDTDNLYYISAANAGQVNGQSFSSVESITGGSQMDQVFFYQTGSLSGALNLGGGVDFLSYSYWSTTSPGVTVNLATGIATATGGISGIEMVVGSQANDVLTGGSGDDVLVGLAGDDVIDGAGGRDLVFGGTGADTLTGGGNDDVVIGGWTSWDVNASALKEMRSIWRDTSVTYADRIDDLRTAGWLDSGHVFADGDTDTETGGNGNDWFWGESSDTITDFTSFVEVQDTET